MSEMSKWSFIRVYGICIIFAMTACLPAGFTNSVVNTAVIELSNFIESSYQKRGWILPRGAEYYIRGAILSCWFIFQVISFMISPWIIDKYGRKSKWFFEY